MDTNDEKLFVQGGGLSNCWLCNRGPKHLGHGMAGKPYEKCIGRGVWAAKNSIPAAARIRRCLQRPESWSVRPRPSRFRFCCGGASGEDKLGGTSLARRSRRRWGPSESLRGEGRNLPPLPTCFRRRKLGGYLASVARPVRSRNAGSSAQLSRRAQGRKGVRDGLVQDELVSG